MLSARYMSQFVGDFCPDEGVVAGYGNRIRAKYTAKWGVQIVEMIFQTRSRAKDILPLPDMPNNHLSLHTWNM